MKYTYPHNSNRSVESGFYPRFGLTMNNVYTLTSPWEMRESFSVWYTQFRAMPEKDQQELWTMANEVWHAQHCK